MGCDSTSESDLFFMSEIFKTSVKIFLTIGYSFKFIVVFYEIHKSYFVVKKTGDKSFWYHKEIKILLFMIIIYEYKNTS